MSYSIKHPNEAIANTADTPEGLADTLRGERSWPAVRCKIIGPPTPTSPPGAVDSCWGYAIKNADGSVTFDPAPTEPA